jgi:hypothetical protein
VNGDGHHPKGSTVFGRPTGSATWLSSPGIKSVR